jgi:uncharacterized protein YoaH (UPF0181 family)
MYRMDGIFDPLLSVLLTDTQKKKQRAVERYNALIAQGMTPGDAARKTDQEMGGFITAQQRIQQAANVQAVLDAERKASNAARPTILGTTQLALWTGLAITALIVVPRLFKRRR